MSDVARLRAVVTVALLGTAVTAVGAHAQEHPGKAAYDRWCAECHGVDGRGDGTAAAWMLPRPRDFTQARYQIRSTASGALPTDADLLRIIENGMPGTAMPGWPKLSRRDRTQLIDYIKTFSPFFQDDPPQPIDVGRAPRASDAAIEEGRALYQQLECWKCHGQAGRGDGPSAPTQKDDNDWPIRPADLTQNWRFNGGGTVQDIYTRLLTGLNGTPMPSSADLIDAGIITRDQLWNVAHYVRSLSPEQEPAPREVIRAVLRATLPAAPDDEAWEDIPSFYVPLVGQIIETPRIFAPTVHSVWVQAAHDNSELVLRVRWTDPSRSPDAAWEEWRQRVAAVMEPHDEAPAEGALADAFAVQFAPGGTTGRDLPYFLMGDARTPVHLWRWSSDGTVGEHTARGLARTEPLAAGADVVRGAAVHEDGQWRLVLRRSLVPAGDAELRPTFRAGEPFPLAFYAWDGSNGEAGKRGSIGSWYFLFLEQPATARVWLVPLLTMLVTALLGLAAVRYARAAPAADAAAVGDVAVAGS